MTFTNLFSKASLGGLALALSGCASTSLNTQQANDPCYGVLITPHTAYNRDMTEASAGVQRGGPGVNRATDNFLRVYGGYRPGYHNGYSVFTDNQGKPSELVYTVTSVNNQVHDVKFKNNSSQFNSVALTLVGLAVGSQIGGHAVANAVIGGVGGSYVGNGLDNGRNDQAAEKIKACLRDVQAGNQDYVVPLQKPQGGRLPVPQSEGRQPY